MTTRRAIELDERIVGGLRVLIDTAAERDGLVVAFSDRSGGISRAPYDSLNLGARVGDDFASVSENRRRLGAALGFAPGDLAVARQIHGADAIEVGAGPFPASCGDADVLHTRSSGTALAILTADCTPVVVAGEMGVAIAHAGWRGLVAGAIERALEVVGPVSSAWVGPSIRSCCYEVGPEVIEAFSAAGLPVAGPDRVDPGEASVAVLERSGTGSIAFAGVCTHCDERYFSYRRDGVTGRQAGLVMKLP